MKKEDDIIFQMMKLIPNNFPVDLDDLIEIWKYNLINGKEKFLRQKEISACAQEDKWENQL